jgi:hypothetical protein
VKLFDESFLSRIFDGMKYMLTIFEDFAEGAEFYRNHGSIWLIFTKDKRWVFELTEQGTLWYNYYFFHKIFNLLGMDIEENQHTITEWVEDTIQNGVINTWRRRFTRHCLVEDTIQNGVRKIEGEPHDYPHTVANIIKNGVKHTEYGDWEDGDERFDDIIKNGVKETKQEEHHRLREVVQTVKNGIKETRLEQNITEGEIDNIIQNGINETWGYEKQPQIRIDDVINKGEKTICNNNPNKL